MTAVVVPYTPLGHFEEESFPQQQSLAVVSQPVEETADIGERNDIVSSTLVDSSTDDASSDVVMEDAEEECNRTSYGGLLNLGNTCYLNSALQMLASLDHFVDDLQAMEPPSTDKTRLRKAFLHVMGSLARGETVTPSEFKQAVDERSSLFVGFRQQDAHEFLTTLLDLLDEDYKRKEEEEKKGEKKDSMTEDDTDMEETVLDNENSSSAEESTKPPSTAEPNSVATEGSVKENEETQSSQETVTNVDTEEVATPVLKKARTEPTIADMEASSVRAEAKSPMRRHRSFSQLLPSEISDLIHGDGPSSDSFSVSASLEEQTAPRYKLVGGRMDTSGVELTPFNSSVSMDEVASSETKTPSQKEGPELESPIDKYFTTEVRARLTCDSCKYSRTRTETYLHWSLDIGTDSGSVEEGIRKLFATETCEVKCEKCFFERATQTREVTKLPRALLLHFKRFIVDVSPDYSSVSYRKNQSHVSLNDNLSIEDDGGVLSEVLATDVMRPEPAYARHRAYRIRGVVNHIGSSASCGHYTADTHRLYADREWTRFNDSSVSCISSRQAIQDAASTAYMVMYELS